MILTLRNQETGEILMKEYSGSDIEITNPNKPCIINPDTSDKNISLYISIEESTGDINRNDFIRFLKSLNELEYEIENDAKALADMINMFLIKERINYKAYVEIKDPSENIFKYHVEIKESYHNQIIKIDKETGKIKYIVV